MHENEKAKREERRKTAKPWRCTHTHTHGLFREKQLKKIIFIILISIFMLTALIVLNKENIVELGKNINNLIERRNGELVKGEEKIIQRCNVYRWI